MPFIDTPINMNAHSTTVNRVKHKSPAITLRFAARRSARSKYGHSPLPTRGTHNPFPLGLVLLSRRCFDRLEYFQLRTTCEYYLIKLPELFPYCWFYYLITYFKPFPSPGVVIVAIIIIITSIISFLVLLLLYIQSCLPSATANIATTATPHLPPHLLRHSDSVVTRCKFHCGSLCACGACVSVCPYSTSRRQTHATLAPPWRRAVDCLPTAAVVAAAAASLQHAKK